MSALPLVSVVTPALDCSRFIEETILSVKTQDYPRLEHVILTAGSTDGTTEIAMRHASEAVRVVDAGEVEQSPKVNEGFRLARGEIVGWLNGDDLYLPGAVRAAVSELMADRRLGMVCADYVEIDENGNQLRRVDAPEVDLDVLLNRENIISQPTVFLRRAAIERVGGVNERYLYAQDYELWLRVVSEFPAKHFPMYWAAYRRHGDQLTALHGPAIGPEIRRASRANGGRFFSELGFTHSKPLRAMRRLRRSLTGLRG